MNNCKFSKLINLETRLAFDGAAATEFVETVIDSGDFQNAQPLNQPSINFETFFELQEHNGKLYFTLLSNGAGTSLDGQPGAGEVAIITDTNGNVISNPLPLHETVIGDQRNTDFIFTDNGDLIVTFNGFGNSSSGSDRDTYILRLDSDGNVLVSEKIAYDAPDSANANVFSKVAQLNDDLFVVAYREFTNPLDLNKSQISYRFFDGDLNFIGSEFTLTGTENIDTFANTFEVLSLDNQFAIVYNAVNVGSTEFRYGLIDNQGTIIEDKEIYSDNQLFPGKISLTKLGNDNIAILVESLFFSTGSQNLFITDQAGNIIDTKNIVDNDRTELISSIKTTDNGKGFYYSISYEDGGFSLHFLTNDLSTEEVFTLPSAETDNFIYRFEQVDENKFVAGFFDVDDITLENNSAFIEFDFQLFPIEGETPSGSNGFLFDLQDTTPFQRSVSSLFDSNQNFFPIVTSSAINIRNVQIDQFYGQSSMANPLFFFTTKQLEDLEKNKSLSTASFRQLTTENLTE